MTAPTRVHHGEQDEFEPVYHHYGPHRAGLPPLVPYFRELWARREFAAEMSKATLRGANVNTFFGQAWIVLNPLLLAGVYYLLVTIIRQRHDPELFTHLTLALFAMTMVQTAASSGATSVTGSGRLLINTAFPRLLIRCRPSGPRSGGSCRPSRYISSSTSSLFYLAPPDAGVALLPADHGGVQHGPIRPARHLLGVLP